MLDLADFFRAGDRDSFNRLVRDVTPQLIGLAEVYAAPDDARDIVKRTWVRAFKKRRQFRGTGSPEPWILSIGRREALKWREQAVAGRTSNRPNGLSDPRDVEGSVLGRLDFATRRRMVVECLRVLTPRERQLIFLRLVSEKTIAEAAEDMRINANTARHHLASAMRKLHGELLPEAG